MNELDNYNNKIEQIKEQVKFLEDFMRRNDCKDWKDLQKLLNEIDKCQYTCSILDHEIKL